PFVNLDEDLLGRDTVDDEDIQKILKQVRSAGIRFDLTNSVLTTDSGESIGIILQQPATNGGEDFYKKIDFSTGNDKAISLDADDIQFIKKHFFMPDIKLWLPPGITRFNSEPENDLQMTVWLELSTDVEYTFPLNGEE
ncbi:MAG: hypothetical protein ACOC0D_06055, partial [Spirochaeta sp.]